MPNILEPKVFKYGLYGLMFDMSAVNQRSPKGLIINHILLLSKLYFFLKHIIPWLAGYRFYIYILYSTVLNYGWVYTIDTYIDPQW